MTPTRSENEFDNRRAAIRWGSFVVGLLSLQVIGGIIAILLATGDESVAVVPNYHQKALRWDEEVAIRTASARLGWDVRMTPVADREGSPPQQGSTSGLQIHLVDARGQPVAVQSGSIEWYRHARAADVQRVPWTGDRLGQSPSGVIHLDRCFDAEGLWQVSLDVRDAEGNRFAESQEINVVWDRMSRNGEVR